jgi:hypothetical protein
LKSVGQKESKLSGQKSDLFLAACLKERPDACMVVEEISPCGKKRGEKVWDMWGKEDDIWGL